jgi:hypothetical protein
MRCAAQVVSKYPQLVPWVGLLDMLGERSKSQQKKSARIALRKQRYAKRKALKRAARAAARAEQGLSSASASASASASSSVAASPALAPASAPSSASASTAHLDHKHSHSTPLQRKTDRTPRPSAAAAASAQNVSGPSPSVVLTSSGGGLGAAASTPRGGVLVFGAKGGVTHRPASTERRTDRTSASASAPASAADSKGKGVVSIELTPSARLEVGATVDVGDRVQLLRRSLLNHITTSELLRVFAEQCRRGGVLDRAGFERAISKLVPRAGPLSVEHQHMLRYLLAQCFAAFDADGSGDVDAHEFVAGISMLCGAADLNTKLGISFLMIDSNRGMDGCGWFPLLIGLSSPFPCLWYADGYVDKKEMADFIGSFLRVVMALNENVADAKSPEHTQALIRHAVQSTTDVFFAAADADVCPFTNISSVLLTLI